MSERYDYRQAVKDSIEDYLDENYTKEEILDRIYEDVDRFREELYDDMFISDSVTGNASGSYFFNTWKAEEALCHNLDLMVEAYQEFGKFPSADNFSAEAADVTIRCYLLGEMLSEVLDFYE